MPKSDHARAVDGIQHALRPFLREHGFTSRGRTFNRRTEDGLTQVVNFQMGRADFRSTTSTFFLWLLGSMQGRFTINLGVYVPEVARYHGTGEIDSWIQESHCCVRARLSEVSGGKQDIWWKARADEAVLHEVRHRLERDGLPFLARYATRDRILAELRDRSERFCAASSPPRIVMAILLAERGQKDQARELLARQALEARNPRHRDYVRRLAMELGIGSLDG